jgi:hypothetical protein
MQKMNEGQLQMKVYTQEKAYRNNERELELFRMIENGALISKDGKLFKLLAAQMDQSWDN